MKKGVIIITGAGLVIGLAEALVYYNMGQRKPGEPFRYKMPPVKELAQTVGVVLITSVLTAIATQGIEKIVEATQPKANLV